MIHKLVTLLAIIILFHSGAICHPSYGMFISRSNEIYFSDVLHHNGAIWKLDQNKNLRLLLSNEHSHYLFQDHRGSIWGTNHEYLSRQDTNRNSLWRLDEKDQKVIVIPPTLNFESFSGSNFVLDRNGNVYYDFENYIYRRTPDGSYSKFSNFQFERVMSMTISEYGEIYVVDNYLHNGSIVAISSAGIASIIASNLVETNPSDPPFKEARFNMLYAISSFGESLYVANSGSRNIIQVRADGSQKDIYQSEAPWYPVAYALHNETEYIMETGFTILKGNFGPRILQRENGMLRVIADTDHPDLDTVKLDINDTPPMMPPFRIILFILIAVLTIIGFVLFYRMMRPTNN